MGEIAGAVARLVHELLLAVEQAIEVARQRRDLGREAAGQARLGAAMDARELVAQATQRRQADARLQPGAGEQHQTDQAERDGDVGDEGAPQRVDRRGVERHREAEGARRAVAVEPHFALHHVDGGVVGSATFDRLSGRREVDRRLGSRSSSHSERERIHTVSPSATRQ